MPDDLRAAVEAKANALIQDFLKPTFVKRPPKDKRWNYLTGISTKWHLSFLYFVGHYASPGPNALAPTFELKFARMEYAGDGRFNLAYFRHTGKWWQVYEGLSLDKALKIIREEGIFHPA